MGPSHPTTVEAVTAALCIDPAANCTNRILGFSGGWTINADVNGAITSVTSSDTDDFSVVFLEAVRYWNQFLAVGAVVKEALPLFTLLGT